MFQSAYLRLTMWYVLIIMTISFLFSVWVYTEATRELRIGFDHQQAVLQERFFIEVPAVRTFVGGRLEDQLRESIRRIQMNLLYFNVLVLGAGAVASYLLAKRTMRPIQEAMDAQNRFTADASHELRTPLAAMKTEIEVALRDKKMPRTEVEELLQSNLEEIDRLTRLSEGLLTLTRDDIGPPAPVRLEKVAPEVIARLRPLAEAKNISIVADLPEATAQANRAAVDKIIGILLDNAIKYSPEKSSIRLQTMARDGNVYLHVVDQGYGIKSNDLRHIFERFYRADTARSKQKIEGHGLGLSIAQQLAVAMEGVITVKSSPDKGSTFTLRLPKNVKN